MHLHRLQGYSEPVVLLSAAKSGIHRDGPEGGAQVLLYNIGRCCDTGAIRGRLQLFSFSRLASAQARAGDTPNCKELGMHGATPTVLCVRTCHMLCTQCCSRCCSGPSPPTALL